VFLLIVYDPRQSEYVKSALRQSRTPWSKDPTVLARLASL